MLFLCLYYKNIFYLNYYTIEIVKFLYNIADEKLASKYCNGTLISGTICGFV